jgi:hypothetical protein
MSNVEFRKFGEALTDYADGNTEPRQFYNKIVRCRD